MNSERLAVSNRISNLIPYQPGKPITDVKRELGIVGEIIKLASNENPLGSSPLGIAALQAALPTLALYPDGACHALREAVTEKFGLSPDSLIFGNGSDEIIHLLGLTFLEPGDEIVVGDPTFVLYETAATLAGAKTVKVPLTAGDMRHDADAMAAACTEKTRLVFVANPHNPTGSVISKADVETLLAALPPRAFLVLDEAYAEYVEDDPEVPRALDWIKLGAPVICLRTFSKLYGLAGFRVGYGVAAPEVIRLINQARSPFNVNLAGQVAAAAALNDTEFIARTKKNNDDGIAQLIAGFEKLGLSWIPTRANFIVVNTGRPAKAMFDALLKQGVIVRAFPNDLPTHLRVTIGTPEQNTRFLEALTSCLT
ncbi:histidinol-phosphate transaminase [Armatimonas sp.]|uniref:histidinol-phosphate transaminase n=1 Tax=Armatimonas sp. TaxID=1872638 RepID=UPI00374D4907